MQMPIWLEEGGGGKETVEGRHANACWLEEGERGGGGTEMEGN